MIWRVLALMVYSYILLNNEDPDCHSPDKSSKTKKSSCVNGLFLPSDKSNSHTKISFQISNKK